MFLLWDPCLLHADDTIFPGANHPPAEGYRGTVWKTSLDDFRHIKSSIPAVTSTLETDAVTHLLLNFHETAPDSIYPLINTKIERVPGDKADYVFYNGRFCMVVIPIESKNLKNFQTFIKTRFTPKELTTYTTNDHHKTDLEYQRYDTQEFDDNYLEMKTGTRAYQVTVRSANTKKDLATFLVYASEDYFTDTHNAWGDYPSEQKKNKTNKESGSKRSN